MKMAPYIFTQQASVSEHALTAWTFSANRPCKTYVVPDGCRDYIVRQSVQGDCDWFISDLSASSYAVHAEPDEVMHGLRLQPGVEIDFLRLSRWLQQKNSEPLAMLNADHMDEFCVRSDALGTALGCLASGAANIQGAAQDLGISPRTLQRVVKTGTGQTPYFWWSLARIRRTARALSKFDSLAETAEVFSFADQAHMTREIRKWFGVSPKQLQSNQELLALLHETGYG